MGFLYFFVALSPCLWLVNKILPFHLDKEKNYYMCYSEGLDSCQRSLTWHQHGIMREQGPIRALVSFTLQRNLIASINWACEEKNLGLLIDTSWGELVQGDQLVSYSLVLIYLRLIQRNILSNERSYHSVLYFWTVRWVRLRFTLFSLCDNNDVEL